MLHLLNLPRVYLAMAGLAQLVERLTAEWGVTPVRFPGPDQYPGS